MDLAVANWFYGVLKNNKALSMIARVLTEIGSWWFIVSVIVLLLCFKKTRIIGVFVGVASLMCLIANNLILKNVIGRARPFEVNAELASICEMVSYKLPTDGSMASGHSASTMAVATMLFIFNKKVGIVAIITSIIVGLTRLCLCVHFLTDVIVGFIIGITFAIITYYLLKYICNKYSKNRGNRRWKK